MNKPITSSQFEPILTSISAKLHKTPNELWYRFRILKYASLLNMQYGGDIDIICALVFLQETGTRFFEFTLDNQKNEKVDRIVDNLNEINFPHNKTLAVVEYFETINKSNFITSPIEHKIVNDAVIMAGLGAIGLARYFMRNEFDNLGINDFAQIDGLFKERAKRLVFPQSIKMAEKENKFTYLFSAFLQQEPFIETSYPGKYIILEGNSGTGKDAQAELLKTSFENLGMKVTVVKEPSQLYRDFETFIETTTKIDLTDSAPIFRLYSIIGDRYNQIHEKVMQELKDDKIVISVRSYISMLVYQCETEIERLFVNFIHRFVPRPDVIILYDTNEEISLQRVMARGTKMTPFDKFESLKKFRPIYLDIAKSYYFDFPVEIINASGTIEQVADETKKVISKYL